MSETYEQAYELADPFSFENPDQYSNGQYQQDGSPQEDPVQYQQDGYYGSGYADTASTDSAGSYSGSYSESEANTAPDQGGYAQEEPGPVPAGRLLRVRVCRYGQH